MKKFKQISKNVSIYVDSLATDRLNKSYELFRVRMKKGTGLRTEPSFYLEKNKSYYGDCYNKSGNGGIS